MPAPPTRSRWRSHAIASSEATAHCRATAGVSNGSACCSKWRRRHERKFRRRARYGIGHSGRAAVLKELANAGTQFCVPCVLVYVRHALLNRGRRRSRHRMTEPGAAADNACRRWSVGRRRALRKGPVRPGIPTALKRLGSRKRDAQAGLANRPKGADRKAPEAPPGAPFPSFEGKRKKGDGPDPGPEIKTTGQRSVGLRGDPAGVAVRKFARILSLLRSELPNQSDTRRPMILVSH